MNKNFKLNLLSGKWSKIKEMHKIYFLVVVWWLVMFRVLSAELKIIVFFACLNTTELFLSLARTANIPPMEHKQIYVGLVSFGDFLFVAGDMCNDKVYEECEIYDVIKRKWINASCMPVPKCSFALVCF